jgi:hypothetical protein
VVSPVDTGAVGTAVPPEHPAIASAVVNIRMHISFFIIAPNALNFSPWFLDTEIVLNINKGSDAGSIKRLIGFRGQVPEVPVPGRESTKRLTLSYPLLPLSL